MSSPPSTSVPAHASADDTSAAAAIPHLRVFLSSPGDVGQERLIAAHVIERLSGEFTGYVELEPILWEHEPLRASDHFQAQIIPPSECDIVVCILWSRLGTRLPAQFQREDGTLYASGTEWEFEDALASFQKTGRPDLMVYKKTAEPQASMADEAALMARLQQKKALDSFIEKWFGSAQSTFRAAFHTFDTPDRFEATLETHLRRLVKERLPRLTEGTHAAGPTGAAVRWHRGSPFRGLQAFDVEHAPVFFGRTRAVAAIKERLLRGAQNGCAFVLVFGMSGSGKSSLVRAGVLPTLTQPGVIDGIGLWRYGILRPTDAPDDLFLALASGILEEGTGLPEMAEVGFDAHELAALLRQAPERAVAAIRTHLMRAAEAVARKEGLSKPPEARFALVVDQLEEIFTLPKIDDRQREGFATALATLAQSGIVWILATMRSDFYPRCAEVPELAALKEGAGQYDVLPATYAEIGQMIRGPARAAGLRFESDPKSGERLDDLLHEAAARDPEGLPLLSFTLEQLWDRRLSGNFLTLASYRDLGGLEGALARRAEEVYAAQPAPVQEALPAILRGLVTISKDGGAAVTARRVPLTSLATTPERQSLIDAFIAARLLLVDRADDGQTVVRVTHEALLRHWPRLVESIEQDREFLLTRDRATLSAARWREEGRRPEFLLPEGRALADAVDILDNRRADLDSELVEFITASRRHVEGRRRRRLLVTSGIVGAFLLCVSGFGAFSFAQWRRAEERSRIALSAVDRLTRVTTTRLAEVPGTRPLLRTLLQENMPLLDAVGGSRATTERFESVYQMGDLWQVLGDGTRAAEAFDRSLKLAEDAHRAAPNDPNTTLNLAGARARVGDLVLERANDPAGALKDYEIGRGLLEGIPAARLAADTHLAATVRQRLAALYGRIGDARLGTEDSKGALDAASKSVTLWQEEVKASASDPAEHDRALLELGRAQLKSGKARLAADNAAMAAAQADYDAAASVLNDVAKRDPVAQRDLGTYHTYVGDLRFDGGDPTGASDAYHQAIATLQAAQHRHPDVTTQGYLADAWRRLGVARMTAGDAKGALNAQTNGIALAREIASNDAQNRTAQEFLALLCHDLSEARAMTGDTAGAFAAEEESRAVTLAAARLDETPAGLSRQIDAWRALGEIRLQRSDRPGALEAAQGALELLQQQEKQTHAGNAETTHALAEAYDRFAYAALLNRRFEEALAAAGEGLAREPDNPALRLTHAHALLLSGKFAEAKKEYLDNRSLKIDGRERFDARALAQLHELYTQGLDTPDMHRMESLLAAPPGA